MCRDQWGDLQHIDESVDELGVNDKIIFDDAVFGPTLIDTITLSAGQLSVTNPVVIEGLGWDLLTIDASGISGGGRVFNVASSGAVAITDLSLTGGDAQDGGAIRHAAGTLTLARLRVHGNTASEQGGGIFVNNATKINMTDLIVDGNQVARNGGSETLAGS